MAFQSSLIEVEWSDYGKSDIGVTACVWCVVREGRDVYTHLLDPILIGSLHGHI